MSWRRFPSITPFGLSVVTVAITPRISSSVRPLAAILAGSICTRIEGFCSPAIVTCPTPDSWLICWAMRLSARSFASISGMVSDVIESSRIGASAGLVFR